MLRLGGRGWRGRGLGGRDGLERWARGVRRLGLVAKSIVPYEDGLLMVVRTALAARTRRACNPSF